MKIEIEIDDGLYEAVMKLVPEGMDLGIALSKVVEGALFDFATHHGEIIRSFMPDATEEELRAARDISARRAQKAFDAASKPSIDE